MKFLFLICVLLLPGISSAAVDAADTKSFEILGIKLNSDSYSVVVDKLGATKLIRPKSTGAGPNGDATFCYRGEGGMRLTFTQGFSESYTHVTGYSLEASPRKPDRNCKKSASVRRSLRAPNGLGLGITRAEVEKILGVANSSSESSASYAFEKKADYGNGTGVFYNLDVSIQYGKDRKVSSLRADFSSEPL